MSALGQKQTWQPVGRNVRFTPKSRHCIASQRMSALCGGFNRSTQHLLILLEEGDCTDMVHAAAEG